MAAGGNRPPHANWVGVGGGESSTSPLNAKPPVLHTTIVQPISRGVPRACLSYAEARRCPTRPGWKDIGSPRVS